MENNEAVDEDGGQPGDDDVEDSEGPGEDGLGHVHVHLGSVSLKSNQHQREGSLLPERSSEDSLQLADKLTIGPALCKGGVDSPHGDQHPCHKLAAGEGCQQVPGGAGDPSSIGDNVDAEDEADVGHNDEETNDEENNSFEHLSKLNRVVDKVLCI